MISKKEHNKTYYIKNSIRIREQQKKYAKTKQGKDIIYKAKLTYNNTEKGRLSIKDMNLRRRYGISLNFYEELKIQQDNKCAICLINVDEITGKRKLLMVDHDHKTGKVRGLLCDMCNKALGHLKEDINIAESLVKYLVRHKL